MVIQMKKPMSMKVHLLKTGFVVYKSILTLWGIRSGYICITIRFSESCQMNSVKNQRKGAALCQTTIHFIQIPEIIIVPGTTITHPEPPTLHKPEAIWQETRHRIFIRISQTVSGLSPVVL